ncbi:MAG: sarcosine oxidase subunit gamma family protein [Gammaproteobacteria bacterium]
MADILRSALRDAAGGRLQIEEVPGLHYVNLRGDPAAPNVAGAVSDVLKIELPQQPNTLGASETAKVFWLGPEEWLLVSLSQSAAEIVSGLRLSLGGVHSAVTDVTSGYTTIRLRGASGRDVLAKGCALDLHPRVFGDGQCAQTLIAKAPVLIEALPATQAYELIVRRSFADYLWHWLHDASRWAR